MNKTGPGRFCPVCKFKNSLEATVCEFCGSPLTKIEEGIVTTRRVSKDISHLIEGETKKLRRDLDKSFQPPEGISIYLQDTKPVATRVDKEFSIGRKIEESDSVVDLIPFGAFQLGVSRRHAMVRQTEDGYEIIDTDSTNGTWLDEQRLVPGKAYPLPSGARLRLGRMQLIIYYPRPRKE